MLEFVPYCFNQLYVVKRPYFHYCATQHSRFDRELRVGLASSVQRLHRRTITTTLRSAAIRVSCLLKVSEASHIACSVRARSGVALMAATCVSSALRECSSCYVCLSANRAISTSACAQPSEPPAAPPPSPSSAPQSACFVPNFLSLPCSFTSRFESTVQYRASAFSRR